MRVFLFTQVMLLCISPVLGQDIYRWQFQAMDVASYKTLDTTHKSAYVSGLLDGVFVAGWLQVGPPGDESAGELNHVVNCITTLQHDQIERIIDRYLSDAKVSGREYMFRIAMRALTVRAILEENPGARAGGCEGE